jgi:hypothetical protein
MTTTREQRRRLEALEAQAEAELDAEIFAFTVATARMLCDLTSAEWFLTRAIALREPETPAEVACAERQEVLNAQYGVLELGEALERHLSRDELFARRDAVVRAVVARAASRAPLSADEQLIHRASAPLDTLVGLLTREELEAAAALNGDYEAENAMITDLARKYGLLPDETNNSYAEKT